MIQQNHDLVYFGNKGIKPIMDIADTSIEDDVKTHALEAIMKIKESSG
ncbi:MAG: hypothetical protein WAM14_19755 [Candidatus Nitrosopolaris sp.]